MLWPESAENGRYCDGSRIRPKAITQRARLASRLPTAVFMSIGLRCRTRKGANQFSPSCKIFGVRLHALYDHPRVPYGSTDMESAVRTPRARYCVLQQGPGPLT